MRKKRFKYTKELDIGDPVEHWIQRAFKRAKVLNLPSHLIVDSAAVIKNAFGEEWLKNNFAKPNRSLPFLDKHPVASNFEIAGDPQIVSNMEIAEYLRCLANVPGLCKVLDLLKNKGQFYTTFLQIAYAYRFMKLGAIKMRFEPPIDEGRHSDLFFLYKNQPFLAECFRPKLKNKGQDHFQDILKYSANKLFDAAVKHKRKIFYYIRFLRNINTKERKEIISLCITSINKLISQESGQLKFKHDACDVKIFNASKIERNSPNEYKEILLELNKTSDFGCNVYLVKANQIDKVRNHSDYEREESSKLFIKYPPREKHPDWILSLVKKIEKKIIQVRRKSDNPRGILIVNSSINLFKSDTSRNFNTRLYYKIIDKHKNIDTIILTSHKWMVCKRYKYIATSLMGPKTILFRDKETLTLNFLENSVDLLKGWPLLYSDKFSDFMFKYMKGEIDNDEFRNYWIEIYNRKLNNFDIKEIRNSMDKFINKLYHININKR